MRKMQTQPLRTAGVLAASALVLGLVACGERVDTAGTAAGLPPEPMVSQGTETAPVAPMPPTAEGSPNAGGMVGNVERRVDDMTITASVNASLARDPDLSAMRINVDTNSGVVTLDGTAPTTAAKDRATTLAQAVEGVAGVNNNLQIESS